MVEATKEMRWLITGANGQLGRTFQKIFDSKGIDYVAFSRADLDVLNSVLVQEIFNYVNPDIVINAAAYTDVEQAEVDRALAFAINQASVANIATASKFIGAKLVHFSTDYVFSGDANSPWKVNDPTKPNSIYGSSKLAGELEAISIYSENSMIIRTAWLYSCFGRNFYKTMLTKALNSKEVVRVVSDQRGQPTSAVDLAELTIKAVMSNAPSGIFHGTNAGSTSWFEFARYIFRIAGQDEERVIPIISSELATRVERPKYSVLDNQKWSEYGISPLGFWEDSVLKMLPDMSISVTK
jgi:dTDP-4-dehydrorhamnose reductase